MSEAVVKGLLESRAADREPESLPLQIRKLQLMLAEFRHPGHGDQSVHNPHKGGGAMGGGGDPEVNANAKSSMGRFVGMARDAGATKEDISAMDGMKNAALKGHATGDMALLKAAQKNAQSHLDRTSKGTTMSKDKTVSGAAADAGNFGFKYLKANIDTLVADLEKSQP